MKYKSAQTLAIGFKKETKEKKIRKEIRKRLCFPLPNKIGKNGAIVITVNYEIEFGD